MPPPSQIILDLDATDDPLHGHQEGRFFHGYHDGYCYLPLYIFAGEHLLCAKLRRSNIDGAAGAREEVERIVAQIRARWPGVMIILRADSGFCREELMSWCEQNAVDHLFALAKNPRLVRSIGAELRPPPPSRVRCNARHGASKNWCIARARVGAVHHVSWPRLSTPGTKPTRASSSAPCRCSSGRRVQLYEELYRARGGLAQRLFQLGQHLEQVTHQPDVGDLEDRGFGILVDGDDRAGILDAGQVLDRARDADGDIQLR